MRDGREAPERGNIYIYLWLIHVVVQQKLIKHCKAIILELKINFKKINKRKSFGV